MKLKLLASLILSSSFLVACGDNSENTDSKQGTSFLEKATDSVKDSTSQVVDSAKDATSQVVDSAKDATSQVVDSAKEAATSAVDSAKEAATSAVDSAKEAATSAVDSAKEAATSAVDSAKSLAPAALTSSNDADSGTVHIVEMKNSGEEGIMVFTPGFIKINKGDTVNFVATDAGHNAISEVSPGEAWSVGFSGGKVTFNDEGLNIYYCTPHRSMGMYGVVQVGEVKDKAAAIAQAEKIDASFAMNSGRLNKYMSQVK